MRYLGLRPAQLVAYALIYSCTVDKGCYDFGAAVLADWSGTSERTARTTIASLLEMGLIVERGSHVHGMNTVGRSLVAATEPIVRAREAWQADHPDAGRSSFRISPEISSREDSSSTAKVSRDVSSSHAKISRDVFSPEVSSPENSSSPENISRERTSSPEISSGEDSSSPAKLHVMFLHVKFLHLKILPHRKEFHLKMLPHLKFLHVKILPHLQFFQVNPPIYL